MLVALIPTWLDPGTPLSGPVASLFSTASSVIPTFSSSATALPCSMASAEMLRIRLQCSISDKPHLAGFRRYTISCLVQTALTGLIARCQTDGLFCASPVLDRILSLSGPDHICQNANHIIPSRKGRKKEHIEMKGKRS